MDIPRGQHRLGEGKQRETQAHPGTVFTGINSQKRDWLPNLRHLARVWHQAELVLICLFPAHRNLLASSRGASGNESTGPDFSRMVAAAECWKKNPNSQAQTVGIMRALIAAMSDVEHTVAAVGELIVPCTQGGTLVGKGGILHILTALGRTLSCADHERGGTECDGLSGVEEAVKEFETERYLADNWERNESLMETTRRVKDRLDRAQSDVLFSNIVAGCRTQCTDYRQAKWVVVRAITESNILVTGEISSASLILAIRRSRFGSRALSSSSGIQYYAIIDVPLVSSEDMPMVIPWMQVTDTGQILCGSRIGGWYIKWLRTVLHRGYLIPEFSDVSQEEVTAIVTSGRTLIRRYPTYIRTRTSLPVDVVCKIGWFVLNASVLLKQLYREVAGDSDLPNPNRLGMRVIDFLRERGLYGAIAEQAVTERSIAYLVINTENVHSWARKVVERCLCSMGAAGILQISANRNTLHCTGAGSPMVDGQRKLESGFFLEHDGHTTLLTTKQGILEGIAPACQQDQMRFLLHGIHAVCDQLSSNLSIKPDFSALQDLGDFSYRTRLQLVPGGYSSQQGRLEEEEATELRKNWLWSSVPDKYLVADYETIVAEGTRETVDDT